jgi:hypothetical protein
VDNCDDSTRDNWAVALDIPGNAPAHTFLHTALSSNSPNAVWLSNFHVGEFVYPKDSVFCDLNGSVDANSSGGQNQVQSVNTTAVNFEKVLTVQGAVRELMGREGVMLARMADAGTNLTIAATDTWGAAKSTSYKPVGSSGTFYLLMTKPTSLHNAEFFYGGECPLPSATLALSCRRSADGAANTTVDYFAFLPGPCLKLTGVTFGFLYDSEVRHATDLTNQGIVNSFDVSLTGDTRFEVVPGKYNIISCYLGDTTHAPTITYTMTYSKVVVTPRWSLL